MENSKRIVLSWIPSHIGTKKSEVEDRIAKEAASRHEEFIPISFKDWYPNAWQDVSRD